MAAPSDVFDALLREIPAGQSVVFDADGTLWQGDVGEDFLRHLETSELLPQGAVGAYAQYEALLAREPAEAYAFCATVMRGVAESALMNACRFFFARQFVDQVFPYVRPLLARLQRAGIEVWVCSASPRWVVQAGAESLGLAASRVIGVDVEVVDGHLTDRLKPPVPCGPGKVAWLKRHGVKPALALGNGALDLEMLSFANRACVVAGLDGSTPAPLQAAAARAGWPVLIP